MLNISTKLRLIEIFVNELGSSCYVLHDRAQTRGTGQRTPGAYDKFKAVFQGEGNEMDQQQPVQGQVQIKADEKELQGQYSNLVMIHHNLEEFTLNFIYIFFPNGTQGKLLSSTIVSPGTREADLRCAGENLARYEAQFGTIRRPPEGNLPHPTWALCSKAKRYSSES